ncbi:MAG: helix-turn-helix domain protein [Bacilli bacterium]|nr:helix-turn-helix domain protein [Bacilli bacterium]
MNLSYGRCLLDQLLMEKGWSQQKLAEVTGINFKQISFYVTNSRVMSLKNAIIIADALGCAVHDLYERFKKVKSKS